MNNFEIQIIQFLLFFVVFGMKRFIPELTFICDKWFHD